jgi:hypothetical protein
MGKRFSVPSAEEVAASGHVQSCVGSRAWAARFHAEEHVAFKPHPPCWKCGANMGCVRCSGPTYELLCMNCKDWGHGDAYDHHGRLLKAPEERAEGVKMLRSIIATAKVA